MSIARMEEVATPQFCKPPTPPLPKTKGILSILGSDTQRGKSSATSIRRTFSADMSSKKWLAQNGFLSPIKKIASSKDLLLSSSEEEEEEELERRKSTFDVWSSILSQKKDDDNNEMSNLETPYVHPLVKRLTSSLSEKSLVICTENLGSENGSDGFSSYTPENGDVDEEKYDHHHHHHHQQQQYNSQFFEELRVVRYNYKRSSSFPPPISSLARGDNKPSTQIQSRRQDGRLILEAISIPPRNLFHAHRHDGRLLLTLESEMEDYDEEFDEVFDDIDDHTLQFDYKSEDCHEQEENEPKEENGIIVMEQRAKLSSGVINMKTSPLMMMLDSPIEITEKSFQFPMGTKFTKFSPELEGHLGLENKNLVTWSNKFNKVVNLTCSVYSTELTKELSQITSVPQSLPTQLTPVTAASFNAYEYFWRKKPTIAKECNNYTTKQVVVASNCTTPKAKSTTKVSTNEQQDLVLMRGNIASCNYLVSLQRGCKEPKRSLLIWEPYCIVTS